MLSLNINTRVVCKQTKSLVPLFKLVHLGTNDQGFVIAGVYAIDNGVMSLENDVMDSHPKNVSRQGLVIKFNAMMT